MIKIKGYKVFNANWTCRDFQYRVGQTYKIEGELKICKNGFHFCKKLTDCFLYYPFDSQNKVAEIEAVGEVIQKKEKFCTNEIKILKELSWYEVLDLVNTGKNNTGLSNSGNSNSGALNSGSFNSGWYNYGYRNSGDSNSGNFNSGDHNSGGHNSGLYNRGFRNSGDYNSGNFNSGSFNACDGSSGFFNTKPDKVNIFNIQTNMTQKEFLNSKYWVALTSADFPIAELKNETPIAYTYKEACARWWKDLTKENKKIIQQIPNFNKDIFEEITGIKIE